MIFRKLWQTIRAQINKLANWFKSVDPIAEMQYECDMAIEQLKDGRQGLEQYRGLVERVKRQVHGDKQHVLELTGRVKNYLQEGDRLTAGKFALELQKAEQSLSENEAQLKVHEQVYENNVTKLKHANKRINDLRERVAKQSATLKMSRTEAEIAKLTQSLNFEVTTDFGRAEQQVQEQIDTHRGEVRVAADLSGDGLEEIKREEMDEQERAELVLQRFETIPVIMLENNGVKEPVQ